jgi:hypothetical protein
VCGHPLASPPSLTAEKTSSSRLGVYWTPRLNLGNPGENDSRISSEAYRRNVLRYFHLVVQRGGVDISYAAPQAYGIINVAFHREFLQVSYLYFSMGGRISIMSKTNTESNSNEYY